MTHTPAIVVFTKAVTPLVQWHRDAKPASFDRAQRELERLVLPGAAGVVDRLRRGKVRTIAAGELVRRVTGRALPAVADARVQRQLERIQAGERLRPILVVGHAVVDGRHRLVAVNHLGGSEPVAFIQVKESTMGKIKKDVLPTFPLSRADRQALLEVADRLRPHSHPIVQGIASKAREAAATLDRPRDPGNGDFADSPRFPVRSLSKSQETLAKHAADLRQTLQRGDLDPDTQTRVRKALRECEVELLHAMGSAGVADWERARYERARRAAAA